MFDAGADSAERGGIDYQRCGRAADSSTDDDSSTDKDARSADQTHTRATAVSQAERKRSEALPQPGVPQSRREKVPPPLAFAQDMYAAEDRRCAMQQ